MENAGERAAICEQGNGGHLSEAVFSLNTENNPLIIFPDKIRI